MTTLRARSSGNLLRFDRPIDRLAGGDFTAVLEAAEAFVDGDYT
jgi:hypothetical protein